jgi:Skp family chaperone for outer membrane proteins
MSKPSGACLAGAVLAVLVALTGPAPVQAQAATTQATTAQAPGAVTAPVVIIVDVQQAQRESVAGKMLIVQRDKYQQSFQSEFTATRQQLQVADQDLAKQKASLSPEAYNERVKGLEQQVVVFQRRTQGAVRALEKSTDAAGAELMNTIIAVTGEIANEMGATLVMHKHQVFLHEPRMDVTALVVERVNKKLPSINFPVPVIDEPAETKPAPAKQGKK